MATAVEAASARTPWGAPLAAGVDTIGFKQEIVFDLYVQVILPLDGYVYWVRAANLTKSALLNVIGLNDGILINQSPSVAVPNQSFKAMGSFHYATDTRQTDDANYSANRVIFTSEVPVQDLNSVSPRTMYIGTFDGPTDASPDEPRSTTAIRFAFSSRGSFYQQANLWHYTGFAIYPTMETQIIDDARSFNTTQLIVSNSLPIWLAYNHYNPPWPVPVPRPAINFYPAMLSPDNLAPPFATVMIGDDTQSLAGAPYLDPATTTQSNLAQDRVSLTIYGANNDVAMSLLQSLLQYSYDTEDFGILDISTVRDVREGQNELNILAQKKRIQFDISYVQSTVRKVARKLVEKCLVNVTFTDL